MSEDNKKTGIENAPQTEGEKPRYVRQYVMRKRHKRTYEESRPEPVFTQPEVIKKTANKEEQIVKELAEKQKKQKAKKLLFLCIIAFILVLLYPLFRLVTNVFVIKEVVIEGESRYSAEELLAASGLLLAMTFLELITTRRQGLLLQSFRISGRVGWSRNYPTK